MSRRIPEVARCLVAAWCGLVLVGALAGCGDTGGTSFSSIDSFQIQPQQLKQGRTTGMTDQHFQLRLEVSNFSEPIGRINLFVQENEKEARTTLMRRTEGDQSQGFFALGSASCVDTCSETNADSLEACVHSQCDNTGNVAVSDDDIQFTLFQDFEPGTYQLGASIESEGGTSSITQRNLQTIEITE